MTNCSHRVGQTALLCVWLEILRGRFRRGRSQLFLQREQFGNGHRHDRPVQFGQKSVAIAATEFSATERLFETSEFDFDSPSHFVKTGDLLWREPRGLHDIRQHPHPLASDSHTHQPQPQRLQIRLLRGERPAEHNALAALDGAVRSLGQQFDVGSYADQKVHPLSGNLCPQGIADKACITAKQRADREYSLTKHVHNVTPLTGVRRAQLPHPGQTQGHVPKHGNPRLWFLSLWFALFVLRPSQTFGFLFAVLGRFSVSVVGCAEGVLIGLRTGCRTARAVKSDGGPAVYHPQLPTDLLHSNMQHWPQHTEELIRPTDQRSHKALVGRVGRTAGHGPAPLHSLSEGIRHVIALRPRPTQCQAYKTGWQPTGIAMKLELGKNALVRKQPLLQLTKLIRVRIEYPPTPSTTKCLIASRPLSFLLSRHEPDSFLTELFSVGLAGNLALFIF